jgi:sulfide:quinone oxidoreductase
VLPTFDSGVAVIAVLGTFFKCPPAPNEAALMLHDYLVRRGFRDAVEIHLITPMPMPIPISEETSQAIVSLLTDAGVHYRPQTRVSHLDAAAKLVHLSEGEPLRYDLFLGIPVHVPPRVVTESGLTEDDGWIGVDIATFATRFPGVYAVGDVTSAPVPRAGVMAEGEAATLADTLIAQLSGGPPPAPFEGAAICYIETGGGEVARVDVNFLAGGAPTAIFKAPSAAAAEEKREFATTRRARWFGYAD